VLQSSQVKVTQLLHYW